MTDPTTVDPPEAEGDQFRASSWDEFIGQPAMTSRMQTHIASTLARRAFLDHTLFAGPSGFGKTTLANIIGAELGQRVETVVLPVKPKALIALLNRLSWGDILFLDEIHRAPKSQQEDLLPLLLEGYLQLTGGGRLEWGGTILAATTEPENLIPTLYDRFPIKPTFEDYTPDDMGRIVVGMAAKVDLDLAADLCVGLGKATAGTPRNARSFVLAARDLGATGQEVSLETILTLCDTDPDGLGRQHLNYLHEMGKHGGTAGLSSMSTLLRLSPSMVREIERVLLKYGYVTLGSSGRELTNAGWEKTR